MSSVGILSITLIEAKLTHDTATIGKMDPYVKFKSRDFVWKSNPDKKGGKHPKWDDATFDIDVKYLGDDLEFIVKDDDKGKDDLIGDGETKLSAFACYSDWDEWFDIEHKGKRAGKVHLKSHWEPAVKAPEEDDEFAEMQNLIKECLAKKRELEDQFHEIKEAKEANEIAGAERIAAAEAEAEAAAWDDKAAEADEKLAGDLERAEAMKAEQDENKTEFESSIADEIRLAAEVRDVV